MSKNCYFLIIILFAANGILQTSNVDTNTQYNYIGIKACKKCHIKQFKSWEKTNMAKAYDILKPGERVDAKKKVGLDPEKDYTKDSECLPCHTTGFGQPGGFVRIDQTPQLVGVSCETCHGAGSEYTKEQYMHLKNKEYKRIDVVKVGLVSRHNEKSPFFNKNESFDFKKRKDQGTHEHYPLKYNHE
jgi:hypothetical protein